MKTTKTVTAYTTPECRADACELCPGPGEVRLHGGSEPPIEVLHCDCDCHEPSPH